MSPGQGGIYLPAGNLHSYLHGVGVEVMANSDNVLRGGLTPKHVDVPELLRVLDFNPAQEGLVLRPKQVRDGIETVYETPAPEFATSVLNLTAMISTRRRCPGAAPGSADPLVHAGSAWLLGFR